eukprot:c26387_g1_i1 orf=355-1536(-)
MAREVSSLPKRYVTSSSSDGGGYIEHRVSKLDTLAGVAIKYGVEVADIKRANGLVTDIQMFALRILKIPLPGRHPPSASLPSREDPRSSNSSTQRLRKHSIHTSNYFVGSTSNSKNRNADKRPVSSAMSLLQGYYGLSSSAAPDEEGTEMMLYKLDSDYRSKDEPSWSSSALTRELEDVHRSGPASNVFMNGDDASTVGKAAGVQGFPPSNGVTLQEGVTANIGMGDIEKGSERSVRRRSKVDGANSVDYSEVQSKHLTGGRDRAVGIGKTTPPRPKTASRTSVTDSSSSLLPSIFSSSTDVSSMFVGASKGTGGHSLSGKTVEGLISKVRRSSSTSNLQDEKVLQVNSGSKYRTKPDLMSVNQISLNPLVSIPLFEGLSKPVGNRCNKAALD